MLDSSENSNTTNNSNNKMKLNDPTAAMNNNTNNNNNNIPPILKYTIHSSSGYSSAYRPEHLTQWAPTDQASRWSSATNDQNQFVMLKLEKPAVIEYISFGKFHKVHVCNLKEFKVFTSLDLESSEQHEILHAGLNNDTEPESFPVGSSKKFPVQFIKIAPMAAWGSNFNFSIWYVEVRGWDSSTLLKPLLQEFTHEQEIHKWKLVLKHLRDRRQVQAFNLLQENTGVLLEDSLMTKLHDLIDVSEEDGEGEGNGCLQLRLKSLQEAEKFVQEIYENNPAVFDEYLRDKVDYEAEWKQIDEPVNLQVLDENGDVKMMNNLSGDQSTANSKPSARGGHQMIWDAETNSLYLLGGWDGQKDLGDLWKCTMILENGAFSAGHWQLLSANVGEQGGPSPRSCHKTALHASLRRIYVLGRYVEPERRNSATNPGNGNRNIANDFFYYDLNDDSWHLISADVKIEGGPGCIYDHQMVIDEQKGVLWVFGGRNLNESDASYSGLYKYDLGSGQWTCVRQDTPTTSKQSIDGMIDTPRIPSRIGHSMMFHPDSSSLLIMGGQRHKDHLSDYYRYDTGRDLVIESQKQLTVNNTAVASGFTQRTVLDPLRNELFSFSGNVSVVGMNNNNNSSNSGVEDNANDLHDSTLFFVYSLDSKKWSRIHPTNLTNLPPARFAHQLSYDLRSRTVFLFGGNPGAPSNPSLRLGDFWRAQLRKKQSATDVLRRIQFELRKAIFTLLCRASMDNGLTALRYLQQDVSAVVNHADTQESLQFRSLSSLLFGRTLPVDSDSDNNNILTPTNSLYDAISQYFPTVMRPPSQHL